tara:strand:+ start:96 stop:452 length:357 start_codon:yes stop_codon:yes gene_type:complete
LNKLTKILIGILVITGLFFVASKFTNYQNKKITKEKIAEKYNGLVIDKFSTRKTEPIFIKIKTSNGNKDISINPETIIKIDIGDSVVKKQNSKYGEIFKKNGKVLKLPFFNEYVMSKY